ATVDPGRRRPRPRLRGFRQAGGGSAADRGVEGTVRTGSRCSGEHRAGLYGSRTERRGDALAGEGLPGTERLARPALSEGRPPLGPAPLRRQVPGPAAPHRLSAVTAGQRVTRS